MSLSRIVCVRVHVNGAYEGRKGSRDNLREREI